MTLTKRPLQNSSEPSGWSSAAAAAPSSPPASPISASASSASPSPSASLSSPWPSPSATSPAAISIPPSRRPGRRQALPRHLNLLPYIIAQVVGAIAASGVLYVIASGKAGFSLPAASPPTATATTPPADYSLLACFVAEVVLTIVLPARHPGRHRQRAPKGFAPIAIGLCLTLIHLIGIPVTNTSVNPARSTGPAIFVGGWALQQLWMFWLAPLIGGVLGGGIYRTLFGE